MPSFMMGSLNPAHEFYNLANQAQHSRMAQGMLQQQVAAQEQQRQEEENAIRNQIQASIASASAPRQQPRGNAVSRDFLQAALREASKSDASAIRQAMGAAMQFAPGERHTQTLSRAPSFAHVIDPRVLGGMRSVMTSPGEEMPQTIPSDNRARYANSAVNAAINSRMSRAAMLANMASDIQRSQALQQEQQAGLLAALMQQNLGSGTEDGQISALQAQKRLEELAGLPTGAADDQIAALQFRRLMNADAENRSELLQRLLQDMNEEQRKKFLKKYDSR